MGLQLLAGAEHDTGQHRAANRVGYVRDLTVRTGEEQAGATRAGKYSTMSGFLVSVCGNGHFGHITDITLCHYT